MALLVEAQTLEGHRAVTSPIYFAPRNDALGVLEEQAAAVRLSAPHPNPTTRAMSFAVTLPTEERVELAVYDLAGRAVETLHQGTLAPGSHTFHWRVGNLGAVRPGLYFIALRTPGLTVTRKVGVMR